MWVQVRGGCGFRWGGGVVQAGVFRWIGGCSGGGGGCSGGGGGSVGKGSKGANVRGIEGGKGANVGGGRSTESFAI